VSICDEYARVTFMPFVTGTLRNTSGTEIVWDDFRPESMKDATRQKTGAGVRKEVAGHVKMS